MTSFKKITAKEFENKAREDLEQMIINELKDKSTDELCDMICAVREARIEKQRQELASKMAKEIDAQLVLMQNGKYDEVIDYIKHTPKIVSIQLLKESKKLIEYALQNGDVKSVDYLLKRRVKMFNETSPQASQFRAMYHGPYVVELLKLDASQNLDVLAKQHIENAVSGKYGDLIMKKSDAEFYYHTKESFIELYNEFKEQNQQLGK